MNIVKRRQMKIQMKRPRRIGTLAASSEPIEAAPNAWEDASTIDLQRQPEPSTEQRPSHEDASEPLRLDPPLGQV